MTGTVGAKLPVAEPLYSVETANLQVLVNMGSMNVCVCGGHLCVYVHVYFFSECK